jgi:hypothetical protein
LKHTRKRALAVGAVAGAYASIGILRYPGSAAQFTYKLANDQMPASFPTRDCTRSGAISSIRRVGRR